MTQPAACWCAAPWTLNCLMIRRCAGAYRWMERGFSKFFLIQHFCNGKAARAAQMGISYRFEDKLAAAVTLLVILVSSSYYHLGMRIPGLRTLLDRQLINRIAGLLDGNMATRISSPMPRNINWCQQMMSGEFKLGRVGRFGNFPVAKVGARPVLRHPS